MKKISIIVPCYNEEKSFEPFLKEIKKIFTNKYLYEIIFVLDPGNDNSEEKLINIKNYYSFDYIIMSSKFGKEACMLAGLEEATGDYITVMDIDLQEPVELIIKMAKKLDEGYDSVGTYRKNRKGEPITKTIFGNIFYKIIKKTTMLDMMPGARDFRLMNKKYLAAVLSNKEKNRFLKGIFGSIGFKNTWIGFDNKTREIGKSNFSLKNLCSYYFDAFVIYSDFLLKFILKISLLFFIVSFLISFVFLFLNHITLIHWLFPFLLFLTSFVLLSTYILSLYIIKIYKETKRSPSYIIDKTTIKRN